MITQGSVGTHFYLIKSGTVSVVKDATPLATLKAGDYFGERALLTEEPCIATVTANEHLVLMSLGKKQFEETLGPLESILEKERLQREVRLAQDHVKRWE